MILIAGDADLVPAAEACKEEGATVPLYYHRSAVSDELLKIADQRREKDVLSCDLQCMQCTMSRFLLQAFSLGDSEFNPAFKLV